MTYLEMLIDIRHRPVITGRH